MATANPWKFLKIMKSWQQRGTAGSGDGTQSRMRVLQVPMEDSDDAFDACLVKNPPSVKIADPAIQTTRIDEVENDDLKQPMIMGIKNVTVKSANSVNNGPIMNNENNKAVDILGVKIEGEVCHMRESPYRILKVAETGNMKEFERLYNTDPTRLRIKDVKGRTVLHAAASKNRVAVLEFVLQRGVDINELDSAKNTAVHAAVENEALDALELLLKHGADAQILNEKNQAPIHLATELNKVCVVKALVKYKDRINVLQRGEHGRTALHITAMYDFHECAEILLSNYKCCVKVTCNNGYYPIHEAAKNASAKTMECIMLWAESIGCSRLQMMKFHDAEGNDPLHSAVNGGDSRAVKLCLENGAKISSQQHNLSTPVHLACSQGALDIVKQMFNLQPEEKRHCLTIADVQRMTPLHCAAMFDHADIVEYLIEEGANINAIDKEKRTPLLLAASKSAWKTVHVLLRKHANTELKDINNRNVMHFIVMYGGSLEEFAVLMQQLQVSIEDRLNEKDTKGCTPMHYASRDGFFRSIESLIKLGARINMKDNDHQSPLHFAAKYGRYNTVRQLLLSVKGPFIINETNGGGLTPLHIASQFGHTRVVQLLLSKGALLHKDHDGKTPFHLAAENGYTRTMELLLCIHSHLLDQVDKDGNTALHLAARSNKSPSVTYLLEMGCKFCPNNAGQTALDIAILAKFQEATMALATHERSSEILQTCSNVLDNLPQALISHMPEVFMAVLDKSITRSEYKKESKDYYVKYNFRHLQCSREKIKKIRENNKNFEPDPLPALNTMVQHGRVELLTHPVSQRYLHTKWHAYGMYFHVANLCIYIIFLAFVTSFATRLLTVHDIALRDSNSSNCSTSTSPKFEPAPLCYINAAVITGFAVLSGLKELFQLYQQRIKYLVDPINLLEWILYLASAIMVSPTYQLQICNYHIISAAVAVFLAWFNFLLYLQRFDRFGIYVVMFLEILKTLIKVLLVFSILIIAFGLAFHVLMSTDGGGNEQMAFGTVPLSLMRVFAMMLGEIDYLTSYVVPLYANNNNNGTAVATAGRRGGAASTSPLPFPTVSLLFLAVFMVFMPILLMNLLIGLAVGDIEAVRRNAQLKRIAMQVELHTELERKLPQCLIEKVDKEELIDYPNVCSNCPSMWNIIQRYLGGGYHRAVRDTAAESAGQEEDFVYDELCKQKQRLKEMNKSLDQQHQLLRLIVQKMEIKTEADDFDEGISNKKLRRYSSKASQWRSPNFNRKLKTSVAFVQAIRKASDND